MPSVVNIFFLILLLILHAFFSGTETALFSLHKIERRRLAERHPALAPWVMDHLQNPRRTLVTILIGNLLVNTLATAIVALVALQLWGAAAMGIAVAVFTLLLVFFGEILPKTLAVRANEPFALAVAIPLRFFSALVFPVRRLTRLVTDWIVALLIPERKEHPDQISIDELRTLVKIGEEEGVLDRQERRMIQKLFELGERPARAVMTPRVEIRALDVDDAPEKHEAMIRKYHFTHFPVYRESMDNILGVISVQAYMLGPRRDLASLYQQPLFVPETKRVDELYAQMLQKKQSFAICVDEYGGTAGVVTLEDILEEIFGEYYDEYAVVENPIRPFGHHEFLVEAKIPLADFNEYFSSNLKAREATTLGGWILEKLGHVPEKGQVVKTPSFEVRVHDVIRQRQIRTVIVRPER